MNIELKMHTGLVFDEDVTPEQKLSIKNQVEKLKNVSIQSINSDNIDNTILNGEFIFIENNSQPKEYLKEKLKKEEYNFKFFTNKDIADFSRKIPYYSNIASIKKNIDLDFKDHSVWNSCILNTTDDLVIIGDIHEHTEPLELLLKKIPSNARIVMLGDYLDKGGETEKTVNFIERLVKDGAYLVTANHESYVAKRLLGKIEAIPNEQEIFSSLPFLLKNDGVAKKVIDLYEKSLPFIKIQTNNDTIFATHAPCKKKYLGKLSSNAMRSQRNYYFPERGVDGMRKELEFTLKEQIDFTHVFGHVAHNMNVLELNNRIWLDTGSVYGNMLSSVLFDKNGNKEFIQIATNGLTKDDLFSFETKKSPKNRF